jgi:hypothetical protein
VRHIARLHDVPESTLQSHIANPQLRTRREYLETLLDLSPVEEQELVNRLVFMNHCNVGDTSQDAEELAMYLYRGKRESNKLRWGRHWFERLLERHKVELGYTWVNQIQTGRANVETGDTVDDFFDKV